MTQVAGAGRKATYLVVAQAKEELGTARAHAAAVRWGLTARQEQVLRLVIDGHARRTIAAMLCIAEKTLEVHLAALRNKAQVDTTSALVAQVWKA